MGNVASSVITQCNDTLDQHESLLFFSEEIFAAGSFSNGNENSNLQAMRNQILLEQQEQLKQNARYFQEKKNLAPLMVNTRNTLGVQTSARGKEQQRLREMQIRQQQQQQELINRTAIPRTSSGANTSISMKRYENNLKDYEASDNYQRHHPIATTVHNHNQTTSYISSDSSSSVDSSNSSNERPSSSQQEEVVITYQKDQVMMKKTITKKTTTPVSAASSFDTKSDFSFNSSQQNWFHPSSNNVEDEFTIVQQRFIPPPPPPPPPPPEHRVMLKHLRKSPTKIMTDLAPPTSQAVTANNLLVSKQHRRSSSSSSASSAAAASPSVIRTPKSSSCRDVTKNFTFDEEDTDEDEERQERTESGTTPDSSQLGNNASYISPSSEASSYFTPAPNSSSSHNSQANALKSYITRTHQHQQQVPGAFPSYEDEDEEEFKVLSVNQDVIKHPSQYNRQNLNNEPEERQQMIREGYNGDYQQRDEQFSQGINKLNETEDFSKSNMQKETTSYRDLKEGRDQPNVENEFAIRTTDEFEYRHDKPKTIRQDGFGEEVSDNDNKLTSRTKAEDAHNQRAISQVHRRKEHPGARPNKKDIELSLQERVKLAINSTKKRTATGHVASTSTATLFHDTDEAQNQSSFTGHQQLQTRSSSSVMTSVPVYKDKNLSSLSYDSTDNLQLASPSSHTTSTSLSQNIARILSHDNQDTELRTPTNNIKSPAESVGSSSTFFPPYNEKPFFNEFTIRSRSSTPTREREKGDIFRSKDIHLKSTTKVSTSNYSSDLIKRLREKVNTTGASAIKNYLQDDDRVKQSLQHDIHDELSRILQGSNMKKGEVRDDVEPSSDTFLYDEKSITLPKQQPQHPEQPRPEMSSPRGKDQSSSLSSSDEFSSETLASTSPRSFNLSLRNKNQWRYLKTNE